MMSLHTVGNGMGDSQKPVLPDFEGERSQEEIDAELERFFGELEAEQSDIPEAVQNIGMERIRDFLQGKMTWAEIFDIPAENLQKMAELGYLQFQSGRLEEAERFFKVLTMLNYANPMFHHILGLVYQKQKKYGEAIVQFSQALDVNPHDGASLVARAEILMQNGWYINAATDLQTALDIPGSDEQAWGKRAQALQVRVKTLQAELVTADDEAGDA